MRNFKFVQLVERGCRGKHSDYSYTTMEFDNNNGQWIDLYELHGVAYAFINHTFDSKGHYDSNKRCTHKEIASLLRKIPAEILVKQWLLGRFLSLRRRYTIAKGKNTEKAVKYAGISKRLA